MRVIRLEAYDVNTDAPVARVFNLMYQSVFMNDRETVGNDKHTARKIVKVMEVLDKAAETLDGGRSLRLVADGADLAFEDVEFLQFKAMWESFRSTIKASEARIVVEVDKAFDGALSMTPDEYLQYKLPKAELDKGSE